MAVTTDPDPDLIARLAKETLACCPPSWVRGRLSIQADGVRMTYQLKNEDSPDKAALSETLRDLMDELYVRMRDAGHAWTRAELDWWRDGKDLKFKIDFDYAAPKGAIEPTSGSPWWRFGRR